VSGARENRSEVAGGSLVTRHWSPVTALGGPGVEVGGEVLFPTLSGLAHGARCLLPPSVARKTGSGKQGTGYREGQVDRRYSQGLHTDCEAPVPEVETLD